MQLEGSVLVLGHGARADVDAQRGEDHRRGVPVIHKQARALFAVQRPFSQHFGPEETELRTPVPLVLVAVAQPQVKHRGRAVPKLGRERRREEVRVRQGFVVHDRHRSPARSRHGEVVGVGQVDALHAPQHAVGAVAPHHNVVERIVCPLHAGEVARHSGRVPARSGIPVGLFDRKRPRAHRGHFIHHLALLRGRHLRRLHGHHALLQLHAQHHWTAARHDNPLQHARLVPDERHLERMSPQRHVIELESAIEVGGRHMLRRSQHLDRRPQQRITRLGIDHRARHRGGLGPNHHR